MSKILQTACLLIPGLYAAAQLRISGSIRDTSESKPLSNAVVSLISSNDSILISFVRTAPDGSFTLNGIAPGGYTLIVTYPKFGDYIETMALKDSSVNMGIVGMTPLAQLLNAVVIQQQKGAIRMRGDTIAYLADSFALKEGSSVEDLLKKLPGIQVDKSGRITAQGEGNQGQKNMWWIFL